MKDENTKKMGCDGERNAGNINGQSAFFRAPLPLLHGHCFLLAILAVHFDNEREVHPTRLILLFVVILLHVSSLLLSSLSPAFVGLFFKHVKPFCWLQLFFSFFIFFGFSLFFSFFLSFFFFFFFFLVCSVSPSVLPSFLPSSSFSCTTGQIAIAAVGHDAAHALVAEDAGRRLVALAHERVHVRAADGR